MEIIRVFYMLDYPLEWTGGSQISTLALGEGLRKKGLAEVYYCCPYYYAQFSAYDKFVLKVRSRGRAFPAPYRKPFEFARISRDVESLLSEIRPDILHTQMPVSLMISSRMKNDSSLVRCHTDRGLYNGYKLPTRFLSRIGLSKNVTLITTTNYNAEAWRRVLKIPILVIPNTASDDFRPYDPKVEKRLRSEAGTTNTIVIGLAGRMTEAKNWPLALHIIEELNSRTKDFYVLLALRMNSEVPQEREEVYGFVESLRRVVGHRLIYKENLTQREMADFYYLVDIFVLTSKFESFGRTAVEAMSRKCCVLGTNVGGIPEVVGDSDRVFGQNAEYFADYIERLIKDRLLLEKKKTDSFMRFVDNFNSEVVIMKHYDLYRRLLKERR